MGHLRRFLVTRLQVLLILDRGLVAATILTWELIRAVRRLHAHPCGLNRIQRKLAFCLSQT